MRTVINNSHPDMLESSVVTEGNEETEGRKPAPKPVGRRDHLHRRRGTKKNRSPLRDIPYLSGSVEERKQQLRRQKRPHQARGERHYMVRKKKARDYDRMLIRTTPRGVKHLYTFWRNLRSPTDVSFEEWFTLRYTEQVDVRGEYIALRRYDGALPWMLSNIYVARMRGNKEIEVLFDAETAVGERKDVKTYVAPPGKMDKRRRRDNERSERGTIAQSNLSEG